MNRSASLKRRIANLEAQIAEAEELLATQNTEHQAHNMFDEFDTNLDSLIDDSEWGGSQPVFDALDFDQNEYLDPSEIEMGFGSSFSKLANANRFKGFARKKLAHTMFEEFDTNLDGVIDQSEWGGSPEAFNALDLDGDSMLSLDEINMGVGGTFGKLASSRKRASNKYLSSEEIANILGGKVISKGRR